MTNLYIFILAGGLGTRLQSSINNVPKPMAPIQDRPFLDYVIDHIRLQFEDSPIYLLTHHLSHIIEDYYKSDKTIEIIKEPVRLGTGGAIKYAAEALNIKDAPLLIINGDTYHHLNFNQFISSSPKHSITIASRLVSNASRYGTLLIEHDQVIDFIEKQNKVASGLINLGSYFLKTTSILDECPNGNFSFEQQLEQWLSSNNLTIGHYNYVGPFIDIGIPEDYKRMIDLMS